MAKALGNEAEIEYGKGQEGELLSAILDAAKARGMELEVDRVDGDGMLGYAEQLASQGVGLQLLDVHAKEIIRYDTEQPRQLAIGTERGRYFMVDGQGKNKIEVTSK